MLVAVVATEQPKANLAIGQLLGELFFVIEVHPSFDLEFSKRT